MGKEVERLKRYSENLKIQKISSENKDALKPDYTSKLITKDLETQGIDVIIAKTDRIQGKNESPTHLDDLTIEEVEQLRVKI